MSKYGILVGSLLALLVSARVAATPIYAGTAAADEASTGSPFASTPQQTRPLLAASLVPTNIPATLPQQPDPLQLGVDAWTDLFPAGIHFMDLIAVPPEFSVDNSATRSLLSSSLHSTDILDDLPALYLSYRGRAFDNAILDLGSASIIRRKGRLITTEGAPISLGDFGIILSDHKRR